MNLDAIKEHYKFLKHKKLTEIRIFTKSSTTQRSFTVSDENSFANIVMQHPNEDIAVGVHERYAGGTEDKDVTSINYLVIDVDTKEEKIIQEIESKLKKIDFKYSAKIFTGQKGYHYYIPIIPIEGNILVRELLENAKSYFLKDLNLPVDAKCFNPSRIFRIWGSNNKGQEVKIIELNYDVPLLDTEKLIPKRTDNNEITLINKEKHSVNQVIEDFPLFEALYKNPKLLPLLENTEFNDVLLKNIASYAAKKGTKNLNPWYELCERKKHSKVQFDAWYKKNLFFNPFEVITNVRKYYPDTLYKKYCVPLTQIASHKITYIENDSLKWEELMNTYRNTNSFMVNNQFQIEGNIILLDNAKVTFKLAKVYQGAEDPNHYYKIYLGEAEFKKGLNRERREELNLNYIGELNASFYVYNITTTNNVNMTVLSEEKITNGYYKFFGTLVKFNDHFKIGQQASQEIYSYLMFLHSYENKELRYSSLVELFEDFNVTGDEYYKYLMTEIEGTTVPIHYKTAEFWKKIYTAFLFSGKMMRGQKLNLIIFGPSGTGKTPQMRAIVEKFNEKKFYTGTSMTVPGLTISFFNVKPKPGALLECQRVCAIDEFFKMFNRMDDVSAITNANDYLDNQSVSASSGKQEVAVKATCQVFSVTNPIRRNNKSLGIRDKMSLMDMFDYINADFWGRFLIINQNKDDREWVLKDDSLETNVIVANISREKFIACYDFFKESFSLYHAIDIVRINHIVKNIQVPEVIEEVYKKICNRVAFLLFDGMVKWKIFSERRTEFVVESDYVDFEDLWKEIINRWNDESSLETIASIFSSKEEDIIKEIKNAKELGYREFVDICNKVEIDQKNLRDKLIKHKLIKVNNEKRTISYSSDMEDLDELEKDMDLNKWG